MNTFSKKPCFEWVIIQKNKEFYLTESQYQSFIENQDKRLVSFNGFSINPAFVEGAYKRPAQELYSLYPCPKCHGNGCTIEGTPEKHSFPECTLCKGTGVYAE